MAWNMKVKFLEACSCAQMCPCVLGAAKPDQEWCSGVFVLEVAEGQADEVDLAGAKAVVHFELAGDFLSGIDKARMYYDNGVGDAQRTELDAIFHGEKGGVWGGLREAISEWLPSKVAAINIGGPDGPGATVEGIGQLVFQPITNEAGSPTVISNAPLFGAFAIPSEQLGFTQGTKFSDPDMREWESLGAGGMMSDLLVWSG